MARRGDNIYHRKDGRWEGRFVKRRMGKRTIFGYAFGKTYHEAKEKLIKARCAWRTQVEEECRVKATLSSVSELWLKDATSFLKDSTSAKYRDYLRCYILSKYGGCNMNDITDGDISSFCADLLTSGGSEGQGLSPKTVTEILRVMRHLRKYAIDRDYAVGYSADCIVIKQTQKPMRVFSPQEQERLKEYLVSHMTLDNLGILLCLSTGIRIGELCALRWGDIHMDERQLWIGKTMQRIRIEGCTKTQVVITSPKSEKSVRAIPLPDLVCKYLEPTPDSEAFLLTGISKKFVEPRTMQNRFKAVLSACSIDDANFHALRHTFATRCVEAGFDAKCLSEILGHASVNITLNRYVHPTMQMKRDNMAKLLT